MNGSEVFKENFGELLASDKVPLGDLEALANELDKGDVAAFFIEPVQGKGVNIPPAGLSRAAASGCATSTVLFLSPMKSSPALAVPASSWRCTMKMASNPT